MILGTVQVAVVHCLAGANGRSTRQTAECRQRRTIELKLHFRQGGPSRSDVRIQFDKDTDKLRSIIYADISGLDQVMAGQNEYYGYGVRAES
jgi:hypothetical protein